MWSFIGPWYRFSCLKKKVTFSGHHQGEQWLLSKTKMADSGGSLQTQSTNLDGSNEGKSFISNVYLLPA